MEKVELTHRLKTQIAALNVGGSSVDEIAAITGLDEETVAAFVTERNEKNGKSHDILPITQDMDKTDIKGQKEKSRRHRHVMTEDEVQKLVSYARSHPNDWLSELAKRFYLCKQTASKHLRANGVRVKGMNYDTQKNEPAAAATATSSKIKTLQEQHSTKSVESQALEAAKRKLLAIYETLTPEECRAWELGEVYAEVVRGLGE